jgi:serine/threonine-protein kinase
MHTPNFEHQKNFNKYLFEEWIGEGGMSRVFRAIHLPTGEARAIKKLHNEFMNDPQVRGKFQSEFLIMQNLNSGHIIRVHEFISNPQEEAFVMELVNGPSLKQRLKTMMNPDGKTKLSWDDETKLRVIQGVLKGLVHVHSKGIVHRDIKPGNIFITEKDTSVKLGDFGIAKDPQGVSGTTSDHTMYAMAPGTYPYISPEQYLMDPELDIRADLYSTGILMWELKTEKRAYGDNSLPQGINITQTLLESTGSPQWDAIIDKATKKDRNHRFSNAREFLEPINHILEDTHGPPGGGDEPLALALPLPLPPPPPPPPILVHYLLIAIFISLGLLAALFIESTLF